MPYAQVLTTASLASATTGTLTNVLVANQGDYVAVANFAGANDMGARIIEMWGIDSAHVAEGEMIYTRPEATHDQQHGWRYSIQAAAFNAVGYVAAVDLLQGKQVLNLFRSDTPQILWTATTTDALVQSWVTEYDDLPGASASFIAPQDVIDHHKSKVGIRVSAVASGTAGAYGAQRAFSADDDRLHANTWYAIEGLNVQTAVTTVSLIGPDFGGQRIGCPAGALNIASSSWFMDQSYKWGKAYVPVFNSNNKAGTLVQVADSASSTSPQIDFQLIELDYPSTWTPPVGSAGRAI